MPETRWPAALGRRGVVASPHPLATVAGLDVLRRGGTAVDAAVAVGATIAVAYPHMTGLGGDSFWLLWNARAARLTALQAAGGAAARATPERYRRHGLSQIPAGPAGGAHGARGSRRALDSAHLQPGAARLDRALGRSPRGRNPTRGRRHPRLTLPGAYHGERDGPHRGAGGPVRAVPRDLSGRGEGAGAGTAARPAGGRAHARPACPRGRARVLRGRGRGRDRSSVRGDREPAACDGPCGPWLAPRRAGDGAVPRRAGGLGPPAVPGTGGARRAGDA